jgi:hypothetical protein
MTTPNGLGLRLRSPKIRRAGKRTHCFFQIMSTYSCRRKLTCCRADWCRPPLMSSLFCCIVQGADWVGTGDPLRRNLLSKWASRCGKVPSSWWRSPTGSLLCCTKSSQLLDDCRVFAASLTRASNSSVGGWSGLLLPRFPTLASDGDGFAWRDFRVDPDGFALGATAGAVGARAIMVTSDGAPLGAGAGLDKSVALGGTTIGVRPGYRVVVAAANHIGPGTCGGNRVDGVLLGDHNAASAPRALPKGPRMAPLRGSCWGRLATPRLVTTGTKPGSWLGLAIGGPGGTELGGLGSAPRIPTLGPWMAPLWESCWGRLAVPQPVNARTGPGAWLGLATGVSNGTGLGGLLGDTTGALRASWGGPPCGSSTGTLALSDFGGSFASSGMELRCSASTGTDKTDGALAWTYGGQGHGKTLHSSKVLFF